jgi:NarL family two-component system response regulator YdfI
MISVLIRASSAMARAGLESLVRASPALEVISNNSDEEDLRDDSTPDAIVAEFENRLDDGVAEALDDASGGAAVILLVHGSPGEWTDTLRQGVRAVLPSNVTAPQLAAAIEAAAVGLVVLHPSEVESAIPARSFGEVPDRSSEMLTQREIEVLRLIAEGLSNKEIAARLHISEHTVKFHVASVMGKLGAASRTEAVMLGIRRGLVLI